MRERGFIALVSILIMGAITLVLALGATLRAGSELDISHGEEWSHQAENLAQSCVEHAMLAIKNDINYAGDEDVIVLGETCHIFSLEGDGMPERTIKVESAVSGYIKRILTVVEVGGVGDPKLATSKHVASF